MLDIAKKYILAFPKEKEEDVFSLIEKEGCFEVIETKVQGKQPVEEKIAKELEHLDYLISSLEFAISYIAPFSKKVSFWERIGTPRIVIKKTALGMLSEQGEVLQIVERVIELEKEREVLLRQKQEEGEKLQVLGNFGNLDFVPQETEHTVSWIVSIPSVHLEKFFGTCFKNKIYQKTLSQTPGKAFFLLVSLKETAAQRLELFRECKAEILPFNFEHSPLEERKITLKKLDALDRRLDEVKRELSRRSAFLKKLKIYHDFFTITRTKLDVKKQAFRQGLLGYVLFWAQEKRKQELEKELKKLSSEIVLVETKPETGETPPVLLENNNAVRPFEYVTEIFGLPRNDELDPTPYLSLFFILFFGICLTDAAYGFLMALLTGIALLVFKNVLAGNKLVRLLFYGGISTLLAGIAFGSYFGAGPEVLGLPFMARFKLIDPIQDTVLFMALAFSLGYLQLVFAQIVKIISGARNKKKKMLLSGVAWGMLYLFGGLCLLSVKLPQLKQIGLWGVVLSGLGIMFVESMGNKLFLKPLVGGIKMLQGLIGTASDILSYSRLMALGLATAVIALIVNQIAGLFNAMIPYVGWLVAGLILIGGHIFNLGINALGAFIHSGRLQFVEFFPKFLEGGGRRLCPTRSELKYIQVE